MTAELPLDVIVVGGSCGGLACAHALLKTGCCNVTVFERASSIAAAGAVRRRPFNKIYWLLLVHAHLALVRSTGDDGHKQGRYCWSILPLVPSSHCIITSRDFFMMNDSAADLDLCDLRANAEGYLCHAYGGSRHLENMISPKSLMNQSAQISYMGHRQI